MKTYSLLRLENGANKVLFTTKSASVADAAKTFNKSVTGFQLDDNGYAKLNETVSFCVAEHFEPCYEL